jgi:hypothetical protein
MNETFGNGLHPFDFVIDQEKQEGRWGFKMHCKDCGAPCRIGLPYHGCNVCEPERITEDEWAFLAREGESNG